MDFARTIIVNKMIKEIISGENTICKAEISVEGLTRS